MKEIIKREPDEEYLKFLQTVSREDLLTIEDEVKLIKQIQRAEGDVEVSKDKLMRANQRFVRAVASRYVSEKHSLEELMVEGNIGLEYAIYHFDETLGFKFISYAIWWIRQGIQRAICVK